MPIPFVEPFRIKMVEPIRITTREERLGILSRATLNLFKVKADDVFIDLLTDSGTNAMSDKQWSAMMQGDESYAGARSYYRLKDAIEDIMGFPMFIPTHQGRAAEGTLFSVMVKPGNVVPSNRHFDTTMGNLLELKARPVDLVVPEAADTSLDAPFKGNMDLKKLEEFIQQTGQENIPLGMLTITNNTAAGQPVSMENIRGTAEIYRKYGIPFFIDACRFAENAYFIQQREPGYAGKSIKEICREIFALVDGCTMSAKKDAIVNIGGFIGLRDPGLFEQLSGKLILHEGFITYGGLAGRDLEAIAQGLYEATDAEYLKYRILHTQYLGDVLEQAGMPIYRPTGGHAVYINAGAALPHISPSRFPGVALANSFYIEGGVRTVEIGSLSFEHVDPVTNENIVPDLELVRLAIPRRVYTRSHLDYVGETAREVFAQRDRIRGLQVVEAPVLLRHFLAKLAEV